MLKLGQEQFWDFERTRLNEHISEHVCTEFYIIIPTRAFRVINFFRNAEFTGTEASVSSRRLLNLS